MSLVYKALSWIISIIFHPLIYAVLGSFVVLYMLPYYREFNISYTYQFLRFTFLLTYILPLIVAPLYYIILKLTKQVASSHHQRLFLLISTTIIYVFSYRIISKIGFFVIVSFYILLCCILMLVSFGITYFWKISLHMIGIGGFTGFILGLCIAHHYSVTILLPFCFLIAGIVGTARLYLNSHTSSQIYIGYGVGFITSVIFMLIFII